MITKEQISEDFYFTVTFYMKLVGWIFFNLTPKGPQFLSYNSFGLIVLLTEEKSDFPEEVSPYREKT